MGILPVAGWGNRFCPPSSATADELRVTCNRRSTDCYCAERSWRQATYLRLGFQIYRRSQPFPKKWGQNIQRPRSPIELSRPPVDRGGATNSSKEMPQKKSGRQIENLELLEGGIDDLKRSLTALERMIAKLAVKHRCSPTNAPGRAQTDELGKLMEPSWVP